MDALRELRWMLPGALRLATRARTPLDGVAQVALFLWLFARSKAGHRPDRAYRVRGDYGTFWLRSHTELLVLWEIYVNEDYAEGLPPEADLIVDVGANIGAAAAWLGDRYPAARIVAAEADPETAALARRNLAGRNAEVIAAAVSATAGEITLYVADDSWVSSTTSGKGRPVTVPAVTLDELLQRGGEQPLVKIDAEGAEHEILRASKRLPDVAFVTGEFHPVPGETWESMLDSLDGFEVSGGPLTPDGRRTFSAARRS